MSELCLPRVLGGFNNILNNASQQKAKAESFKQHTNTRIYKKRPFLNGFWTRNEFPIEINKIKSKANSKNPVCQIR